MSRSRCRILVIGLLLLTVNTYALRDPTRPPGISPVTGKEEKAGDMVLKGIIHSDKRNFAIINGKKLEVGDMIAGSKLLKIEKTAVYLKDGDKVRKLTLVPHQTD